MGYGRRSNEHDMEGIAALLADGAQCYGCAGKQASLEGMTTFRRTYPKVWWKFDRFWATSERAVSFSFQRFWTGEDGLVMRCTATEEIVVSDEDLILSIAHTTAPSIPEVARD